MEVQEEKVHREGKAPIVEEKERQVPTPQKTPSPFREEEAEHQGENLNDYDEYAGDSNSKDEESEEEEEEQEEEDKGEKDPS